MPDWLREETFQRIGTASAMFTPNFLDFNPTLRDQPVSRRMRPEVYEFFRSGGRAFLRTRIEGDLEVMVLPDRPEPEVLALGPVGVEVAEAVDRRLQVCLVVHHRPGHPLRVPLAFDLDDPVGAYRAAALCEQRTLSLYYLARRGDDLSVAFCRQVVLGSAERETLRQALFTTAGVPASPSDPDLPLIGPDELTDEELTAHGWAYQYDLEALSAQMVRGEARTYLNVLMLRAVRALAQYENASIRRGPFLAWRFDLELLNEDNAFTDGVAIVITPGCAKRAWSGKTKGEASWEGNACHKILRAGQGCIRLEAGAPLDHEAWPVLRYSDGVVRGISGPS